MARIKHSNFSSSNININNIDCSYNINHNISIIPECTQPTLFRGWLYKLLFFIQTVANFHYVGCCCTTALILSRNASTLNLSIFTYLLLGFHPHTHARVNSKCQKPTPSTEKAALQSFGTGFGERILPVIGFRNYSLRMHCPSQQSYCVYY